MLKFENVSKSFGKNISALYDISFTIEDQEFVFLVGPSGAGKSTILNLMNCQMVPSQGDIYLDDIELTALSRKDIPYLRRKIGSIFQDYKLLVDRTVYENVALPLEIIGVKDQQIKATVDAALAEVGLEGKERLFPRELAGGEVQRVAIARAIVNGPSVLLADEPTADLDEKNAWMIVKLLEKMNNEHKTTVIMATHNLDIVNHMKKRVITLENGHIISDTKKEKKEDVLPQQPEEERLIEDHKEGDN